MRIPQQAKNIIFQISAILILLAAIAYNFVPDIAKYVMIIGVSGYAATTFTTPYQGKSLRGKRLFNIQIFAVLLMVVSTYLMFVDINGWIVTLLIAALLTLYCSIILPKIQQQEDNKKD